MNENDGDLIRRLEHSPGIEKLDLSFFPSLFLGHNASIASIRVDPSRCDWLHRQAHSRMDQPAFCDRLEVGNSRA